MASIYNENISNEIDTEINICIKVFISYCIMDYMDDGACIF